MVLVEADGVGEGRPLGVENERIVDGDGCAGSVVGAEAVGGGVPSAIGVARACQAARIAKNGDGRAWLIFRGGCGHRSACGMIAVVGDGIDG